MANRRTGTAFGRPHAYLTSGALYAEAIAERFLRAAPDRAAGDAAAIRETDASIAASFARIPPEKRNHHQPRRIQLFRRTLRRRIPRPGRHQYRCRALPPRHRPARRANQVADSRSVARDHNRSRIAQALAREAGAVVGETVYSEALSPPGGPADTYLTMVRRNITLFAATMAEN